MLKLYRSLVRNTEIAKDGRSSAMCGKRALLSHGGRFAPPKAGNLRRDYRATRSPHVHFMSRVFIKDIDGCIICPQGSIRGEE